MTRRPGRSLRRRAGTVLGVLVVCLVMGELALRLAHVFRPSFVFEAGSQHRFRGRPHAPNYGGRLNARGFNDLEFAESKPPGVYRIAALGDSLVFGVVPYRHNFLTLLEERLRAEGRPVEILNMGIPATSPEDHALLLAAEALALEPDLVLLFIYVGNDFTTLPAVRRSRWTPYLLDLARFLLGVAPHYEGGVFHSGKYHNERPSLDEAAYRKLLRYHMVVFDPTWRGFAGNLERLRGAVRGASELCRRHGLRLAVVLQPAEIQVDRELLRRMTPAPEESPAAARLDLERPNRALRQALAEDGVPCLDLLPPFAEAGGARRLYKPRDTHWNIAGNELAADLLHAWLTGGGAGLELPPPEARQ